MSEPQTSSQNSQTSGNQSVRSSFTGYFPDDMKQYAICPTCYLNYNLNDRVPMNLCNAQHHICLLCVNEIIPKKRQCPYCMKDINMRDIYKNRIICQMIQSAANKRGVKLVRKLNPQNSIIGRGRQVEPYLNQGNLIQPLIMPNIADQYQEVLPNILMLGNANQSCLIRFLNRIFRVFELVQNMMEFKKFKILPSLSLIAQLTIGIIQIDFQFNYPSEECLDKTYEGMSLSLRQSLLLSFCLQAFVLVFWIFGISLGACCFNGAKRMMIQNLTLIAFFTGTIIFLVDKIQINQIYKTQRNCSSPEWDNWLFNMQIYWIIYIAAIPLGITTLLIAVFLYVHRRR